MTLKVKGVTNKTCSGSPGSTTWDSTTVSDGRYTLEADAKGSLGGSNVVQETVQVANTPPPTSPPPSAPTNVHAVPVRDTQVNVTWSPSTSATLIQGGPIAPGIAAIWR